MFLKFAAQITVAVIVFPNNIVYVTTNKTFRFESFEKAFYPWRIMLFALAFVFQVNAENLENNRGMQFFEKIYVSVKYEPYILKRFNVYSNVSRFSLLASIIGFFEAVNSE